MGNSSVSRCGRHQQTRILFIDQSDTDTCFAHENNFQMMQKHLNWCFSENNIRLALWKQNCAQNLEKSQIHCSRKHQQESMLHIDPAETKTFVRQNIFLQMMRNDLKMCQSEKTSVWHCGNKIVHQNGSNLNFKLSETAMCQSVLALIQMMQAFPSHIRVFSA